MVILVRRRRTQHAERRHRGRGLRPVLLQLRRQHRHPAQPPAPRRLQPADRRRVRRAAGRPHGARVRRGVEHRSEQDRDRRVFGRRRAGGAGGGACSRTFDKNNSEPGDPLAAVSSRPDFVGIDLPWTDTVHPRPATTPIPANAPPAFITCAGSDDAVHAVWADRVFRRDAEGTDSEYRDAHLRQRCARQWPEGPRRHAVRHLAVPLHRLVPRPRASSESPASRPRRRETWPPTPPHLRRSKSGRGCGVPAAAERTESTGQDRHGGTGCSLPGRIHRYLPGPPPIIAISSSCFHGRVRSAVMARTCFTVATSTGDPSWPHSRRM